MERHKRHRNVTIRRMLYMVIERFKERSGEAAGAAVYRRFRDRGRMAPPGLEYVSSWVDVDYRRCFQVLSTDQPHLLDEWMANWLDLTDFEVVLVRTSADAAAEIAPRL